MANRRISISDEQLDLIVRAFKHTNPKFFTPEEIMDGAILVRLIMDVMKESDPKILHGFVL